jgi:hypothetical protein
MNRVWKHFFKNLAWPVGIAAYLISVATGAAYVDSLFTGGGFVVVFVFLILPFLAYLVRDMWLDAKRKVEWENKDMMQTLKGKSNYDR